MMTRYIVRFIPKNEPYGVFDTYAAEATCIGEFYAALLTENPGAAILYKTLQVKSYG